MKAEELKSNHKLTFSDGFQRETVPPVDNYEKTVLQKTGSKWGKCISGPKRCHGSSNPHLMQCGLYEITWSDTGNHFPKLLSEKQLVPKGHFLSFKMLRLIHSRTQASTKAKLKGE